MSQDGDKKAIVLYHTPSRVCYNAGMTMVLLGSSFLPELHKLLVSAERSIWVALFEWTWYEGQHAGSAQDISRAVAIKAKEGLDVRVLLHNEAMGRHLHKVNHKTAGHLRTAGAVVKFGSTGAPLHAKVWLVDSRVAVVGSHNLSVRAVRTNVEVSVVSSESEVVDVLVGWFEELWTRGIPATKKS
jgi:phosphatidylserine/phosphatidylglycerophosphate/cardiolipin synthase-like enzyme